MQYRQVVIPSVGTVRLVQQPAQLNVADKVITPPAYTTVLSKEDIIPDHQLNYLAASLQQDKSGVAQSLKEVGERLKSRMQGEGFDWKGIGRIRENEPLSQAMPALESIPAERVLRQNAEHNVLRGDQQMTSTQIAGLKDEETEVKENGRSIFIIIGWILLVLSILFIAFLLYQGKFRVGSTGSKRTVSSKFHFPYNTEKPNTFFL